ncbi:hypothetical protein [Nocardia brasiliensis]|uniref:hypothetical protein n=1 Tax=Nocardia brasiliensis TaxID=37326 RepID=UPI003D942685
MPAQLLVQDRIQAFRIEDGIGEVVRIQRWRLQYPVLLVVWQAEPMIDAQFIEELLNLALAAISFPHTNSMSVWMVAHYQP